MKLFIIIIIYYNGEYMKSISCLELNELINTFSINIIDLRNKIDFSKNHIPNSINFEYETLINNYKTLLNKLNTYYLICDYGISSSKAAKLLDSKGYNVITISGGFSKWQALTR